MYKFTFNNSYKSIHVLRINRHYDLRFIIGSENHSNTPRFMTFNHKIMLFN